MLHLAMCADTCITSRFVTRSAEITSPCWGGGGGGGQVVALDFCNKNVIFVMCISITSWDTWVRGGRGSGIWQWHWIAEI